MPSLEWIVCIFCIWLSISYVSAENTAVLNAAPLRWELPSPLDWSVALSPPIQGDKFTILLQFQNVHPNGPDIIFTDDSAFGGSFLCYIQINYDDGRGLTPDNRISHDRKELQPLVNLNQLVTVSHLRLICPNIVLQRSDNSPTTTAVTAAVTVRYEKPSPYEIDEFILRSATFPIHDILMLLHQYSWKSNQRSMTSVTFTFHRPASMSEQFEYELIHPLFDYSTIPYLHSSDGNTLNDLGRLYNLAEYISTGDTKKFLQCDHSNSLMSSEIVHTFLQHPGTTTLEVLTRIILPSNAPTHAYHCTFTLDYPADVIHSILRGIGPYPTAQISSTIVDIPFPGEIPAQYDANTSEYGIYLWHSPHHGHDVFTTFDFGLAMTDRTVQNPLTMDGAKLIDPLEQPNMLTFSLQIVGSPTTSYPFAGWGPEIACREHGEPSPNDDQYIPMTAGHMPLEHVSFSGVGKTCSLRLTTRPSGLIDDVALQLTATLFNTGQSTSRWTGISIINAFHRFNRSLNPQFFITRGGGAMTTNPLPLPIKIPFFKREGESPNTSFLIVDMDLQYLLSGPMQMYLAEMTISLIFVNARGPLNVLNIGDSTTAKVTMISRGKVIVNEDDVPINVPNEDMYPFPFPLVDDGVDPLGSILQHNHPIRSPQIHIRCPTTLTILEATQPLRVSIQIPVAPEFDGGDTMYVMLAPALFSNLLVYSSEFARITPVRTTPLTGFSYRCVKWDQMAAPYVYSQDAPLPLTDDNSFECPSDLHDTTGDMDEIDSSIWRRTESMISGLESQCFYELAAVCVAPSATVQGAYDVHPLADCPSFLGQIHAIPCSLVDNEPPEWNYSIRDLKVDLSPPKLDEMNDYIHEKRSLTLWWTYTGDPRLTLSIAIKPLFEGEDIDGEHQPEEWITLARDIPAYLSPPYGPPGLTIGFPILNPRVESVLVKMELNGVPDVHQIIEVDHPMAESPYGGYKTGCEIDANKVFDDITHLCKCQDGTTASGPTSVENPLVHPLEFDCELPPPPCESPDFEWDATTGRCVDEEGNVECDNHGVWSPSFQRCVCMTGYYGQYCQYDDTTDPTLVCEELQCVADHTMKGDVTGENVISNGECEIDNDVDNDSSSVVCNCADGFTGDQCQHQAVCGLRQCVNGRLVSPTGKPEQCKCECNNDYITGSACNQCTLACRNGGVANTRCTTCQCPAGYIGTTCTIPVWYHTFTLRNLPQHIVELILGTTASDKEQMAILQQTMVKYLLEDYSRVLSETFIVVGGNGSSNNGNNDGNPDGNDTRIRVRVELSQFQTVIPPANPNAPYVHIQLMLYPADMTEEMLAYALQHGLDFDWSRVTDNLEFFRKFLREQGIVDDDDDLTPDIDDPGCTTRECREKIIEEESSNPALPIFTSALALSIFLCLVAIITLFSA